MKSQTMRLLVNNLKETISENESMLKHIEQHIKVAEVQDSQTPTSSEELQKKMSQ
jgi:hypothetical protein